MAAIYQQARPATFAEVVGQDHVKDVLVAALERGKASHAYLFSGPRGVGKTTTARLLAMALNCEAPEGSPSPCGACASCKMVREGNHPDVIELDAASNNSVDDVRELRERTTLASMRGGTRVWILDEAHMLSRAAANALLKTLEEPPPGLVFVLATTEPEKLPPTVLSRCQHYRFRRLSEAEIRGKLQRLCESAGVEAQEDALALVAKAADGAMRDAESLLERLLTKGSAITAQDAEEALGLPPAHRIDELARALAAGNLALLFEAAGALYRDGFAPRSLAENLTRSLRDTLRRQVLAGDGSGSGEARAPGSSNGPESSAEEPFPLGREQLLRLIHVLDDEQERFVRKDDLYSLEVALLKGVNSLLPASPAAVPAAGKPRDPESAASPVAAVPQGTPQDVNTPAAPESQQPAAAPATGPASRAAPAAAVSSRAAPPRTKPAADQEEGELPAFEPTGRTGTAALEHAAQTGDGSAKSEAAPSKLNWRAVQSAASPQLKAFLKPATESIEGDEVVVSFDETHRFHYSQLLKHQQELAHLIEEVAGPGYRLTIAGPEDAPAKKS